MNKKKAQVTVFIIIGIIVVALFAMFIYLRNSDDAKIEQEIQTMKTPLEFQPIKNYVEQCIEGRSQEVIQLIALQGGYYGISDYPLEYVLPEIDVSIYLPYYLYNFENTILDQIRLEEELSSGIIDIIDSCMDFSMFHYNITVDTSKLDVQSKLSNVDLRAKILFTINIQTEDKTNHVIDQFDINVQTDIFNKYIISKLMTDEQYVNGNEVCISCLSDMINSSGYNLDMVEIEGEYHYIIIYSLSDDDLVYNFAHRFNFESSFETIRIEPIDDLNAVIDYAYSYQVSAIGVNLTYSDDSDLFDIDSKTGLITFTPKYEDSGEHIVTINVEDLYGNKATEIFSMTIEDFGSRPTLYYIGNLYANVGETLIYDVNASSNDDLIITYIDDSDLFDINLNTGIINFITTQAGVYGFNITAIDQNGNYDIEEGILVVS